MGDVNPSLYQITKYTKSSITGGVMLHGNVATSPATASISTILTENKNEKKKISKKLTIIPKIAKMNNLNG